MTTSLSIKTHIFYFSPNNWIGWQLGKEVPSFYCHHDGSCHGFDGIAVVDQIRKTFSGEIEVIVGEYPDEAAARKCGSGYMAVSAMATSCGGFGSRKPLRKGTQAPGAGQRCFNGIGRWRER